MSQRSMPAKRQPFDADLQRQLSPLQFYVTQQCGTEPNLAGEEAQLQGKLRRNPSRAAAYV